MNSYINQLNYFYPHATNSKYDIEKLSLQSLISLANPLQIYSAFSILYTYGIKGEKQLKKIPMIKFGKVRHLPALNYSLTPFGSQYHFINYVRYKHMLITGDFNSGDNTFNKFYGLAIKGFNIIDKKRITMNFQFDIWNQPNLELEKYTSPDLKTNIGEAFKLDVTLRPFIRENKLGLFTQIGYKSKGYIIGENLSEGFIMRYGISLHL